MAHLYPSREVIVNQNKKPEEGELALIDFLSAHLDDNFEIFSQANINGDRPDLLILSESGVLIFEVKDWKLGSYIIDERKNWRLKSDNQLIKSPLQQVYTYKENLFELHVDNLIVERIKNPNLWAVAHCGIYFHNAKEHELREFLTKGHKNDKGYNKFLSYFEIWGRDSLNESYLKNRLKERWLNRPSQIFTKELHQNIRWLAKPSYHEAEEGINITYSSKQKELINSRPVQQKIRGVAGSGKTLVLAKRAVEAHKRTEGKILVLTYNITLKNYIHDRISDVRENFYWSNFQIINYHQFILAELNNFGIKVFVPDDFKGNLDEYFEVKYFSNRSHFEQNRDNINQYSAVFIDEIQDYKTPWLNIIKDFYLLAGGELVLFGDEKQNIYAREMHSDGKPNTGIPGRWNELNETYRLKNNNIKLSEAFQREFMSDRYELDVIREAEQGYLFTDAAISHYKYLNPDLAPSKIGEFIINLARRLDVNLNDITVLGETIETLRDLEYPVRNKLKQNTNCMFENWEMYQLIEEKCNSNKDCLKNELRKIRKSKKFNFWMNRGHIKFSTIHSFKGWEIHTLILLIETDRDITADSKDELVYTGLTRCMNNLIVLNLGNNRYDEFFKEHI